CGYKAIVKKLVRANGALHWILAPSPSLRRHKSVSRVIISFDVEHDVFKQVPLAPGLQESLMWDSNINSTSLASRLGNLDECLSVILGDLLSVDKQTEISIWVMKEYGVRESWTKMYSITRPMMTSIKKTAWDLTVWDFIHGLIIFLKDDGSLVLYDPRHKIARDMDTGGLLSKDYYSGQYCMEMYLESIVSLNSGTYLGQDATRSCRRPTLSEKCLTKF
ncbi:hypothetical protein MKW92_049133, partial [Papaver armeniacum]